MTHVGIEAVGRALLLRRRLLLLRAFSASLAGAARLLIAAVIAVLMARLVVVLAISGELPRDRPCAVILEHECVAAAQDPEEARLTPVLAPGVAHLPVRHHLVLPILVVLLHLLAPTHDGHHVVHHPVLVAVLGVFLQDAALVVVECVGRRHTARDGPALDDLGHDSLLAHDDAVFGHGGVGVMRQRGARAAALIESGACARNVHRLACRVDMLAPARGRFGAACEVRVGRGIRDVTIALDPLVHAQRVASMARTRIAAAVQNVLDRQVDIRSPSAPLDLDPVAKRRKGRVRPARAAVLRNMLVQDGRQPARSLLRTELLPLHLAPRKLGGQLVHSEVRVRLRAALARALPHLRALWARYVLIVARQRGAHQATQDRGAPKHFFSDPNTAGCWKEGIEVQISGISFQVGRRRTAQEGRSK